jgi:hypothetical protein
MIRALPLLFVAVTGCAATADGEWPSLARRPGEIEGGSRGVPVAAAGGAAAPAAATPAPPAPGAIASGAADSPAVDAAAARIADISREFGEVEARWQRQRTLLDAAVAAASRAAPDTPEWSKAQLELTRLERLGATMAELRDSANIIAGDLAQGAAAGSDVGAALASAGTLLDRLEAARATHLSTFEAAQRQLAR